MSVRDVRVTCACAHVWAVAWWLLADVLDVVRASLLFAVCETLGSRYSCVFHGLNSQVFLDSCRLFWACLMPCVPRGSRDSGVLHMLTRWTLHGLKLATCAGLAALRPSVFHSFSTIKKSLIVATWRIFCQIWHADGEKKRLFWNYSCVFSCPLALVPCGLRDFF